MNSTTRSGIVENLRAVGVSLAMTLAMLVVLSTPEDGFRCFMGSDIEVLAIGNCLLRKEDQDPALRRDYKAAFELD
jgi:hypothetical protein